MPRALFSHERLVLAITVALAAACVALPIAKLDGHMEAVRWSDVLILFGISGVGGALLAVLGRRDRRFVWREVLAQSSSMLLIAFTFELRRHRDEHGWWWLPGAVVLASLLLLWGRLIVSSMVRNLYRMREGRHVGQ